MSEVTRILHSIDSGDAKAAGELLPLVYEDLRKLAANNPMDALLRELLPATRLPVLHPDQRLDDVLRLIQGHALLPVVSRAGARVVEGVVSLPDILNAYQKAT